MKKIGNKKYFGELPLEGPTKLNSLYKNRAGNFQSKEHNIKLEKFLRAYLPASQLAEYSDLSKESADKILEVLHKEQQHRHKKDLEMSKSHVVTNRIRLICSFIFAIFVVVTAVILSFYKAPYVAIAVVVFGLAIYILTFKQKFSNRHNNHKTPYLPHRS